LPPPPLLAPRLALAPLLLKEEPPLEEVAEAPRLTPPEDEEPEEAGALLARIALDEPTLEDEVPAERVPAKAVGPTLRLVKTGVAEAR
jgi:hypothetical protein